MLLYMCIYISAYLHLLICVYIRPSVCASVRRWVRAPFHLCEALLLTAGMATSDLTPDVRRAGFGEHTATTRASSCDVTLPGRVTSSVCLCEIQMTNVCLWVSTMGLL